MADFTEQEWENHRERVGLGDPSFGFEGTDSQFREWVAQRYPTVDDLDRLSYGYDQLVDNDPIAEHQQRIVWEMRREAVEREEFGLYRPGLVYEVAAFAAEDVVLAVNKNGPNSWQWSVVVHGNDGRIREHHTPWTPSLHTVVDRPLTPHESALVAVYRGAGERRMTEGAAEQAARDVERGMDPRVAVEHLQTLEEPYREPSDEYREAWLARMDRERLYDDDFRHDQNQDRGYGMER